MNFEEKDDTSLPKSRKKALDVGEDFYYTDKPCKRGHLSKRRATNRNCLDCERMFDESRKEYFSQYAEDNKEQRRENSRRFNKKQSVVRAAKREESYWNSIPKELWDSVVSKEDAINKGLNKYFTGLPCKYGHVAERYVTSRSCVECAVNREQEYNPERARVYAKARYENYKTAINSAKNDYFKRRLKTDKNFKALKSCRAMLRRTLLLSGGEKKERTHTILKYSSQDLCQSIESKFLEGMSWSNYGDVWHIDHGTPITRYIKMGITSPEVINHLDNLIPMFSQHNRIKSSRTLEEFVQEFPEFEHLYGKFLQRGDNG